MITKHTVTLHHQLIDESEVELTAEVSHIGHPNELEVVWTDASQAVLDELSRDEQCEYVVRAELAWHDRMRELDQDTDDVVRADCMLDQMKDERI